MAKVNHRSPGGPFVPSSAQVRWNLRTSPAAGHWGFGTATSHAKNGLAWDPMMPMCPEWVWNYHQTCTWFEYHLTWIRQWHSMASSPLNKSIPNTSWPLTQAIRPCPRRPRAKRWVDCYQCWGRRKIRCFWEVSPRNSEPARQMLEASPAKQTLLYEKSSTHEVLNK